MTYQPPAYEQVTIAHGGNAVTLRPSLRAAVTLESRYGFPALFRALADLNMSIISEIILTASSRQDAAAACLAGIPGKPLLPFFIAARQPLADLLSMFMPAPDPKAKPSTNAGNPVPWSEVYAALYDSATGWLGWTPEAAWNATPNEITRTYAAHIDRLVTTGVLVRDNEKTAKAAPEPDLADRLKAEGLDPEFDRAGLRALKAKIAGGSA